MKHLYYKIFDMIRDFVHHRHSEDATSVDRIAHELLQEVPSPVHFKSPKI